MEELKMSETQLTSASAFVEGGIQDACDDSCSICLEEFSESDPATVTGCKHEYHLQCILEWCQRSLQCPMCLQSISLKDPSSQELLDGIEHERNMRNRPRNPAIIHHPTLGDFELQHLPVNATDSELEERIIQHLAAAAAMGRTRHLVRREGQRGRPSSLGRSHFLVFSTHPSATSSAVVSPPEQRSGGGPVPRVILGSSNSPIVTVGEDTGQLIVPQPPIQANLMAASEFGSSSDSRLHGTPNSRPPTRSSPSSQDTVGTSDLQSFSESLKTRLNSISSRYKESITKSTRGWRERLFIRNSPMPESRAEVRRVPDDGAATIANMMERLGTREENRTNMALATDGLAGRPPLQSYQHSTVGGDHRSTDNNSQPPC